LKRAPRIGVVGARRARQGLGPFVAKWFARHGAEVVAHAGTSARTVDAATADLARLAGVESRGYVGLASMLAGEDLDAVAVLTPPEVHGAALTACLDAGLHVLCEKPLVWARYADRREDAEGAPRSVRDDSIAEVAALEKAFAHRGLVLWENCQWPATLPSYRALFPAAAAVPRRFEMYLEPASRGVEMAIDALSHPLSLLQALLGPALAVHSPTVRRFAPDRGAAALDPAAREGLQLLFEATEGALSDDAEPVGVRIELRHAPEQPRRAWYALDGLRADRRIRAEDYTMEFTDGDRSVTLPDPLERHIEGFLAALAEPPSRSATRPLTARMKALVQLVEAVESTW